MSKYFVITIFAILLILLVLPQVVSAGLVPCGRECEEWKDNKPGTQCLIPGTEPDGSRIPYKEAQPCSICHFFIGAQKLLNGIGFVIAGWAAVFIVVGGIMILTAGGSPEGATKGKKTITYAIMGVVIAFFAWFIINEVMLLMVGEGTGKKGVMPWPWNKIECYVSPPTNGNGNGEEEDIKKYCICEIPAYTLDPNDFPNLTVVDTEIKGTELTDEQACSQDCVSGNASTYCYQNTFKGFSEANLYCASQNNLESKQAHCIELEDISSNDAKYLKHFSSQQACLDSVDPTKGSFDKECGRKCWIDGMLYCDCVDQGTVFLLSRTRREKSVGTFLNAFSCIINCKYSGGRSRWGSFQEPTGCSDKEEAEWCQRAPTGSENWKLNPPPNGAKDEQKGDASAQLIKFINCMYDKLPDLTINSISSNILCDNPNCDTSTSNCGHAANSCHFGGTNCTGESYAVDFHTNVKCSDIKAAAQQCDSTAWVNWEGNHTHVSVNGTACGCDKGTATPCGNESSRECATVYGNGPLGIEFIAKDGNFSLGEEECNSFWNTDDIKNESNSWTSIAEAVKGALDCGPFSVQDFTIYRSNIPGASACSNISETVYVLNCPEFKKAWAPTTGHTIFMSNAPLCLNPVVLAHELGHSFADLCDEYVKTGRPPSRDCPNCCSVCTEEIKCDLFTDCYEGCNYQATGLYRGTENSTMNDAFTAGCNFGPVNTAIINQILGK